MTPYIDTQVTPTAICTGNPTRDEWLGCTPASENTCTDVVDHGSSPAATVQINWLP